MADRTDHLTLTVTEYKEKGLRFFSKRKLGTGRWAIDVGRWSLIIECWWVR